LRLLLKLRQSGFLAEMVQEIAILRKTLPFRPLHSLIGFPFDDWHARCFFVGPTSETLGSVTPQNT
jgi:hypothetical protein